MRHARELEPSLPVEHALSAHVEFAARDFTSALRFARLATVIDPQFWIGQFQLAQVYEQLGDHESLQQALEITERFGKANSKMISLRGYILARLGRKPEARQLLHALETLAGEHYVPAYSMALVHAGLGERDAAFLSLDVHCWRETSTSFSWYRSQWDTFREDPRFLDLLDALQLHAHGASEQPQRGDRGAASNPRDHASISSADNRGVNFSCPRAY